MPKANIENLLAEAFQERQQLKTNRDKKAELAAKVAASSAVARKQELAARVEAAAVKVVADDRSWGDQYDETVALAAWDEMRSEKKNKKVNSFEALASDALNFSA